MNNQEAIEILKSGQDITKNQFSVLHVIANEINNDRDSLLSKELVLRSLEQIECFSDTKEILYSLVREIGLFPYLEQDYLTLKDSIAYEYHRPYMLNDIVFHQEQLPIYLKIMEGKNIVLSAPTSFGKSKIVDALIASAKFQNIVIVVPTLALIDETRRRLTKLFSSLYHIVSHPSQAPTNEKIYLFLPQKEL